MDNKGYGYMGSRIPFILNTERKPGEKKVKDINENGEYATFDCIAVDVDVAGLQPSGELSITENNTYDVTSYASAVVNVPNPSTGTKDITANGNNIDVKDYAAVNVNVPNPSQGTYYIYENGTHNVKNYEYANVNVSGTPEYTENADMLFAPNDESHPINISFDAVRVDMYDGSGHLDINHTQVASLEDGQYKTIDIILPIIVYGNEYSNSYYINIIDEGLMSGSGDISNVYIQFKDLNNYDLGEPVKLEDHLKPASD